MCLETSHKGRIPTPNRNRRQPNLTSHESHCSAECRRWSGRQQHNEGHTEAVWRRANQEQAFVGERTGLSTNDIRISIITLYKYF